MNEKFNANGQVVWIDPEWVTGDTCVFTINSPVERAIVKRGLNKIRTSFIAKLERQGFVITYDRNDITDDVICLVMDSTSIKCDSTVPVEFKRELDRIVFDAAGEKLNFPKTVNMESFFEKPFFPAVLKNEIQNGGVDKFLIENPEQLEKVKKLYERYSDNPYYKQTFSFCVFQQLIETPTEYKTYMRVLVSGSGELMGASLKYSEHKYKEKNVAGIYKEKEKKASGLLEKHFWDENSEYYLDTDPMFNYYSGGSEINFCQPRYSYKSCGILEAHGIDGCNPNVPSEVLEVCSNIVTKCNRQMGIMCGLDFIYNDLDKKWYYLEFQSFPAIDEWLTTKGIRKMNNSSLEGYVKYCEFELQAREEALIMTTKKKQVETTDTDSFQKVYS